MRHNALCYCKQDWCNLYGLREKYCQRLFIISPPGLASSFLLNRNFSKGVRFSNKIFPEVALKKTCQHIFQQITTPPQSPHLDHDQDRAAAFSIYLVNDDLEHTWMLNVRTNKCVRTNICKKSVFVVSVRNINICGRIPCRPTLWEKLGQVELGQAPSWV